MTDLAGGAARPLTRSGTKEWARTHFRGICNVVIPSYTAGLSGLNEAGIRHDVRRNIELGFWGALLVSEVGTTVEEYLDFVALATDEARGRQHFLVHGSFDTLGQVEHVAARAAALGVTGLLMSYPNSFYPRSATELESYTRQVCEASDLAVVLFCAPHFNFQRLHTSGFPLDVWERLVDIENVVALKYEVGTPGEVGSLECFRRFGDRILVCDPYEPNLLVWDHAFGTPWIGTSNYEYLGATVPRLLELSRAGEWQSAYDLYWQVHPARRVREQLRVAAGGANFNHRYLWKFQAWLQGYNGGPLRMPAMKLTDDQMRVAADSLVRSGLLAEVPGDFGSFFAGRHP